MRRHLALTGRLDSGSMGTIRIVDVTDLASFDRIPPCASPTSTIPGSCNYWEDADHGSKSARASWLKPPGAGERRRRHHGPARPTRSSPISRHAEPALSVRHGAPGEPVPDPGRGRGRPGRQAVRAEAGPGGRGRLPTPAPAPALGRGLGVTGSFAKVLLDDDVAQAYAQFGPLTAYPRAQRTRDLCPALPESPLPAVISCIATTSAGRGAGLARALVAAVCDDLAERGFTAVETYPEIGVPPDATSAATQVLGVARLPAGDRRRAVPGDAP